MIQPQPITLTGAHVRLLPLSLEHLDGLCAAGLDEELWKWVPMRVLDRQAMREYMELALDEQRRGASSKRALCFYQKFAKNGIPLIELIGL